MEMLSGSIKGNPEATSNQWRKGFVEPGV